MMHKCYFFHQPLLADHSTSRLSNVFYGTLITLILRIITDLISENQFNPCHPCAIMNKLKLLIGVLILIFNQLSAIGGTFIHHPSEDDSLKLIEKVYLHIDRDSYYPGDDILFKAYLIDALDHIQADDNNIANVELHEKRFY
jgi:hypothetical protein